MTVPEFLTYHKFIDRNDAKVLSELLKEKNIEFLLEDHSASFDPAFANNETQKEYRLKLKRTDFEKADEIQKQLSIKLLDSVDKDHYLFNFSDEELMELIEKGDEWSHFDYTLAQKILKDRGKEINKDHLSGLRKQRIEVLARPDNSQKLWIIAGYIFALLGGLLGLFIGWLLLATKKTLPNGDSVYAYSGPDRLHGKRIIVLGIIFLLLWIIISI